MTTASVFWLAALIALALSTVLNAVYFMKTVIRLYTPEKKEVILEKNFRKIPFSEQPAKNAALICFVILNLVLGLGSQYVVKLIESGLNMFA